MRFWSLLSTLILIFERAHLIITLLSVQKTIVIHYIFELIRSNHLICKICNFSFVRYKLTDSFAKVLLKIINIAEQLSPIILTNTNNITVWILTDVWCSRSNKECVNKTNIIQYNGMQQNDLFYNSTVIWDEANNVRHKIRSQRMPLRSYSCFSRIRESKEGHKKDSHVFWAKHCLPIRMITKITYSWLLLLNESWFSFSLHNMSKNFCLWAIMHSFKVLYWIIIIYIYPFTFFQYYPSMKKLLE